MLVSSKPPFFSASVRLESLACFRLILLHDSSKKSCLSYYKQIRVSGVENLKQNNCCLRLKLIRWRVRTGGQPQWSINTCNGAGALPKGFDERKQELKEILKVCTNHTLGLFRYNFWNDYTIFSIYFLFLDDKLIVHVGVSHRVKTFGGTHVIKIIKTASPFAIIVNRNWFTKCNAECVKTKDSCYCNDEVGMICGSCIMSIIKRIPVYDYNNSYKRKLLSRSTFLLCFSRNKI